MLAALVPNIISTCEIVLKCTAKESIISERHYLRLCLCLSSQASTHPSTHARTHAKTQKRKNAKTHVPSEKTHTHSTFHPPLSTSTPTLTCSLNTTPFLRQLAHHHHHHHHHHNSLQHRHSRIHTGFAFLPSTIDHTSLTTPNQKAVSIQLVTIRFKCFISTVDRSTISLFAPSLQPCSAW